MMSAIIFSELDLADDVVCSEEFLCQVSRGFSSLSLGFFRQ